MNAIITLKSLESVKTTDFIFTYLEKKFWAWFNHNSKNNRDIKLVYFGSSEQRNLANVKGAIMEAIEYIQCYMEDEELEVMPFNHIEKVDYEGAFSI